MENDFEKNDTLEESENCENTKKKSLLNKGNVLILGLCFLAASFILFLATSTFENPLSKLEFDEDYQDILVFFNNDKKNVLSSFSLNPKFNEKLVKHVDSLIEEFNNKFKNYGPNSLSYSSDYSIKIIDNTSLDNIFILDKDRLHDIKLSWMLENGCSFCFSNDRNIIFETRDSNTSIWKTNLNERLSVKFASRDTFNHPLFKKLLMTQNGTFVYSVDTSYNEVESKGSNIINNDVTWRFIRIFNGKNLIFAIELNQFDRYNLSSHENLLFISFSVDYFVVIDLTNVVPNPPLKTFYIKGVSSIQNVIMSKNGKFLYVVANKEAVSKAKSSLIIIDSFDFEGGSELVGVKVPNLRLNSNFLAVI